MYRPTLESMVASVQVRCLLQPYLITKEAQHRDSDECHVHAFRGRVGRGAGECSFFPVSMVKVPRSMGHPLFQDFDADGVRV